MKDLLFKIIPFIILCSFVFFTDAYAQIPDIGADVETHAPKLIKSASKSLTGDAGQDFITFRYQLRILGFLTIVSLLPFGVMMLTSFTRISIIFNFLRQALGYQQVPSNQIVIGLSLILTGFIMQPVIRAIQDDAINPYLNHEFTHDPDVVDGQKTEEIVLLEKAWKPLRNFLLRHTREKDLLLFLEISDIKLNPEENDEVAEAYGEEVKYNVNAIPWYCLIPSFVMSELRIAFMMGFLLFLPFLIIDMVVASILMSMGMMMLPPVLVSTPFKLLLFILVDGWRLIIQQIIHGF